MIPSLHGSVQRCESPLIRILIGIEKHGLFQIAFEGEGDGVIDPEFDGQVQWCHALLVYLIASKVNQVLGTEGDQILAKVHRGVSCDIILEH